MWRESLLATNTGTFPRIKRIPSRRLRSRILWHIFSRSAIGPAPTESADMQPDAQPTNRRTDGSTTTKSPRLYRLTVSLVPGPLPPTILLHNATKDELFDSCGGIHYSPDNKPQAHPNATRTYACRNRRADGQASLNRRVLYRRILYRSELTPWGSDRFLGRRNDSNFPTTFLARQ